MWNFAKNDRNNERRCHDELRRGMAYVFDIDIPRHSLPAVVVKEAKWNIFNIELFPIENTHIIFKNEINFHAKIRASNCVNCFCAFYATMRVQCERQWDLHEAELSRRIIENPCSKFESITGKSRRNERPNCDSIKITRRCWYANHVVITAKWHSMRADWSRCWLFLLIIFSFKYFDKYSVMRLFYSATSLLRCVSLKQNNIDEDGEEEEEEACRPKRMLNAKRKWKHFSCFVFIVAIVLSFH